MILQAQEKWDIMINLFKKYNIEYLYLVKDIPDLFYIKEETGNGYYGILKVNVLDAVLDNKYHYQFYNKSIKDVLIEKWDMEDVKLLEDKIILDL